MICNSLHTHTCSQAYSCLQTMQDPSHKIIFKTSVLKKSLQNASSANLQMHVSPIGLGRAEGSCALPAWVSSVFPHQVVSHLEQAEALCSTQYTAAHPAAEGLLPSRAISHRQTRTQHKCAPTAKLSYIFWYTLWWLTNMRLKPNLLWNDNTC